VQEEIFNFPVSAFILHISSFHFVVCWITDIDRSCNENLLRKDIENAHAQDNRINDSAA
jgi:hypothetical protein